MLFTFHGFVTAYDASNFLSFDAWRLVAATVFSPNAELSGRAGVLAGCAFRLTLSLRDALHNVVGAGPAGAGPADAKASLETVDGARPGAGAAAHWNRPAPRPRSSATDLRAWLSAVGSSPFDDASAGFALVRSPQVLTSPASRATAESEGRTPSAFIYLDLTDVVRHAVSHDSFAGIPRVQLELATSLFRSSQNLRVIAVRHRKWCDLRPLVEAADGDVDAIFRLIREAFADLRWTPRGFVDFLKSRHKFRALKRRACAPQLKSCETLFVGGAFWDDRKIIDLCRRAADRRVNLIVLLHDLIPLVAPYFTGHDFRAEYLEILRLPAHFIVTTPRNARDLEAVRQGTGAARLFTSSAVVPLADEFPGSERNAVSFAAPARLARLAGEDFVLCVGTVEIRKNHLTLLLAWEELAAEFGDQLPRLVVAGRRGWKADAALEKLDKANSSGDLIQFVEAPSDRELRWLYSSCLFTVFPSYFEGWGLPVGESFWFGKPCAVSNASSIPFVGRDLCSYFSPFDAEDMKAAIRALLNSETRRSSRAKIRSTPLRTWGEVARDIETIIMERSAPSERCEFPSQLPSQFHR